jgi:hypothetical protein
MELRVLLSATLCAAALAACGGSQDTPQPSGTGEEAGSGAPAANEPGGTAAANAVEQPAEVVASSSGDEAGSAATDTSTAAAEGKESILSVTVADATANVAYNFEGAFTKVAPGWFVNWWGNGTVAWAGGRETRAGYAHGGSAAQWFTVQQLPTGGAAHFVYSYGYAKDASYTSSVWLRADTPTTVEVLMRRDVAPWNIVARQRVTIGTAWQQVQLSAVYPYDEGGSLRIVPMEVGKTIYIDDMAITKTAGGTPAPVGGTTLPAAGPSGETLTTFASSTMEESYTRFAPGWYYNAFGYSTAPVFTAAPDSRAGYAHGGSKSQKFQVTSKGGGELHLTHTKTFVKGKTYRASAWVRTDAATPVQFFMRRDEHPYDAFGSKTATIGTTWTLMQIEGTFIGTGPGSLRFGLPSGSGTIWVDDVKIEEVQRNDMAPFGTGVVQDTLFGMHVNKLGSHFVWPAGTRIIRLHNTGTTWRDLEPTQNGWNWASGNGKRMDMYVDYAVKNGGQVLYTLGQTPAWASSTPALVGMYGAGASGAPKDMNDWRDYVRTLATRYVGKIRYWELWNEPDFKPHWGGTHAQLVEMARIAAEELHAVDPQNRLVGPGFTAGQGMLALDQLLDAGLGKYIDDVGYHFYYSTNPEGIGAQLDNVRNLMKEHGIGSKALWITEGAFICDSLLADCAIAQPTAAQLRSVNARAMFMMATRGVANFNFYLYESGDVWRKLVDGDYSTLTETGRTFSEARSWLRGTRIVDAFKVNGTIHVLRLARGTETSVVLWSTQAGAVVNVPSAWGTTRMRTITGTDAAMPADGQITIGLEPVLLRP